MRPANDNARANLREATGMSRSSLLFGVISAALAALAMIAGLLVTDPPWVVRKQRLDDQRIRSVQVLSDSIGRYYQANGKLPPSLAEIGQSPSFRSSAPMIDPITAAAYEYLPGSERDYKLCAVFDLASKQGVPGLDVPQWAHQAGRQCFDLTAPAKSSALIGPVLIDF